MTGVWVSVAQFNYEGKSYCIDYNNVYKMYRIYEAFVSNELIAISSDRLNLLYKLIQHVKETAV